MRLFGLNIGILFLLVLYTVSASDANFDGFRIQKLNLVWEKALKRLSEQKLKILFSDLKIQEKEELLLKRAIADGLDKDGLKEAEARRRLKGILVRYGLADSFGEEIEKSADSNQKSFNEAAEEEINKQLFKDKKLHKLWMKAEQSGFTETELKALREEFVHHQEKVDEYYSLLERNLAEEERDSNTLDNNINGTGTKVDEMIRQKHRAIKDGYDRLQKMSLTGPDSKEFIEPKVQYLWKMALTANFSPQELESLHTELRHYENRIVKLHYLEGQSSVLKEKKVEGAYSEKDLSEKIKQLEKRTSKLHIDLEDRIMQKRVEL